MDIQEIRRVIKIGEDSKNQFKKVFTSPDLLAAEIVAFANTDGGKIIVGIDDDGQIVGLTKQDVSELNQMISNVCSQKVDPNIAVTTENIMIDNKIITAINVPMGTNKFYMANGKDIWVKVGADKRRAKREEMKRLLQESTNLYADEQVAENTTILDLSEDSIQEFIQSKLGEKTNYDKEVIKRSLNNMKILKGDNCTLGGLLLFGRKGSLINTQFFVAAVSWYGTSIAGTEYRESDDIYGNISLIYQDTMAFIKRQLKKLQMGQNFNSVGILEIPEDAIQEALVNAIIHRNYFINSNIRVFVLDDRLEIISPGALPNSLDIEAIKLGLKVTRNPVLLSFIKDLHEVPFRGVGSGIPRIIESCKKAGIKVELINQKEGVGQFKVVFWRKIE
jgi:ATP-dependent DNA helicase RecG